MSTTIVPGSLIAAMIFSAGFAGFGLLVCLVVARLGTPIRGIWWLAGMCAAGMAYQLIIAAVHTAPNAAAVFEIKPWQHLCSLIQVYTMAGFLAVYMQLRYARTLLKIVGLPVGVLVLLIFIWSPTAQFQETYSLQVMHFPWGEQLSILHGKLGTAALIGRLLFLSFFIWALAHVFTQRAHDERTGANIITVGLLSLIVSLVIGYLVDSGVIDFIHTAGFGYIIFATLALYSVIQELEDRQTKLTHTATALTREMDEHRQARQTVEHLSFNDRLTDLPSRTGLFRLIDKAIATGKQQNSRFAVLHVDIDRFDVINDTLGPHVGDQLLRHVSVRLRNLLQGRDFVARINADEFVCVVSDPAAAVQAGRTAVSIHELLRSPFEIDNHVLHITASIGVAMYPDDADSVDTLMTAVDLATREAKRLGRDRTEIFHHELNTAIQERMHLGNALRVALAEQQFELYFQPQIDARSGQIAGLEALIRWHHPTRGMVPPDRFIPLAE
jgi:diguanylate cyclase (GGDEF)-like protein